MATSDELLTAVNTAIHELQTAQQTVVGGVARVEAVAASLEPQAKAGVDANTLSAQGLYYCTGCTAALNYPVAGTLLVSVKKYEYGVFQIACGMDGTSWSFRTSANGGTTWSAWGGSVLASGNQIVAGIKTFSDPPVLPAPTDESDSSHQAAPLYWVKDQLRAEVEKTTGGRNTIVRDADGNPHCFVVVPRFNLEDIDAALGSGPHPAFIANGVVKSELLIGKYEASKSAANKVLTLPGKAPWVSVNFDDALAACKALGPGFSLVSNAAWVARALWLYKEKGASHEYLGNSNWGRSHTNKWETGVMQTVAFNPGDTGNNVTAACLTGTGPDSWNDDGTPWGISDLVGNVWEWCGGLRINNGEIQVLANNDAMLSNANMAANSPQWKAILQNGSLVAPGTANTLKYNGAAADTKTSWANAGAFGLNTAITNQNVNGYYGRNFREVAASSGVTVPGILKTLGLYPIASTGPQGYMYMCNKGERLPFRGGSWRNGSGVGPFALSLDNERTYSYWNVGFRAAFLS